MTADEPGWSTAARRAIARAMYVSVHTLKHHVQDVLRKLEVPDRRRAAERVAALGSSASAWPQA